MREFAQEIYENYLDEESRKKFQSEFGIYWPCIQSAMPLPVAEQLLKLIKDEQLIFYSFREPPFYDEESKTFKVPYKWINILWGSIQRLGTK